MASAIASELAAAGFLDAAEVGRGGSGVVYRCYQKALGRSVAVKVLASDLDEDDRERFLREGFAMGGLSGHPNIVNILQVGVTESHRPFIVMSYHAAGSLAHRVHRDGRIPWPEALRIGVKLCGALETAHRTDTLHRDIKPANVLVNDYGEPLLSDFGTARIAGGYKTVTGYFTGTLSYTAPEVLSGKPPTVMADVYSLGATIFALIAGTAPHERQADEELIAHYLRITSTPVPDLRPEGIPADVCAAIEKAMALDPTDRHASAEEFGRELQLAQRHNGLTADTMALTEPAAPEQSGSSQAPAVVGARRPARTIRSGFRSGADGANSIAETDHVRAHRIGQRVEPAVGGAGNHVRPPDERHAEEVGSQANLHLLACGRGGTDSGDQRCLHRHVVARDRRWRSRRVNHRPLHRPRKRSPNGGRSPTRASPATR